MIRSILNNKKFYNIEVFIDSMVYDGQRCCAGSRGDSVLSRVNFKSDCSSLPEKVEVDLWCEENMTHY